MIPGKRVDGAADPDHVVGSAPSRALDGDAEREAGIDIGERHDLGLAVVPAPAAEQADFVGHSLLEIDDVAVFDAAGTGLRDIDTERRIIQGLAIASGKGTVEP